MNRKSAWILVTTLAVLLSGCAAGTPEAPDVGAKVAIKDDLFVPDRYEATAGEVVTWKNVGKGTHTVTVQDPEGAPREYLYNEELIGPGGTAEFVFPGPGTYDVFCSYHSQGGAGNFESGMVMKVVVA